ncbi:M28 family peptidase [Nakamurella aerolata]|uniref:M28 family peptidase n=1 Tax=Nakamurella aerolata TaxID=1656892 RepID=A0A849ACN2_9ACTN|nr:M28 family peptidase [Nakamurella aerolata]
MSICLTVLGACSGAANSNSPDGAPPGPAGEASTVGPDGSTASPPVPAAPSAAASSVAASSMAASSVAASSVAASSVAASSVAASSMAASSAAASSLPDSTDIGARVDAVDERRLMAHVERLAASPRDNTDSGRAAQAAADYSAQQLRNYGVEVNTIPVQAEGIELPVVWTEIGGQRCPGTATYVLVGHYDTVPGSPGADDNASGTAAVLETARVLAKAGLPISVTLAVLPFEEPGPPFRGALALLSALQTGETGRRVLGAVSAEMVGFSSPELVDGERQDVLYLLGYQGAETLVTTFAAASDRWGAGNVVARTVPADNPFIWRSDHAAFHDAGIPAAMATDGGETRNPNYHKDSDRPDTLSPAFLAEATRTFVGGLAALSARSAPPSAPSTGRSPAATNSPCQGPTG